MLSDRQVEVFDCIRNFIAVANYAPTYGELQMLLGMKTKSHVHYHLLRLREAGLITWRPGRVRSIRIQKTEDRSQNTESRIQKSEDGSQNE